MKMHKSSFAVKSLRSHLVLPVVLHVTVFTAGLIYTIWTKAFNKSVPGRWLFFSCKIQLKRKINSNNGMYIYSVS